MDTHHCINFEESQFSFELDGNVYETKGYQCQECKELYPADKFHELMLMRQQNVDDVTTAQESVTSAPDTNMASNEYLNHINEYIKQQQPSDNSPSIEDLAEAQSYLNKDSSVLSISTSSFDSRTKTNRVNTQHDLTNREKPPDVDICDQTFIQTDIDSQVGTVSATASTSDTPDLPNQEKLGQLNNDPIPNFGSGPTSDIEIATELIENRHNLMVSNTEDLHQSQTESESKILDVSSLAEEIVQSNGQRDISHSSTVNDVNESGAHTLSERPFCSGDAVNIKIEIVEKDPRIGNTLLENNPQNEKVGTVSVGSKRKIDESEAGSQQAPVPTSTASSDDVGTGSPFLAEAGRNVDQSTAKRPKLVQHTCVICPKDGSQFVTSDIQALLEHLKSAHQAKVMVTSFPSKPTTGAPMNTTAQVPARVKTEGGNESSVPNQNLASSDETIYPTNHNQDTSSEMPRLEVVEEVIELSVPDPQTAQPHNEGVTSFSNTMEQTTHSTTTSRPTSIPNQPTSGLPSAITHYKPVATVAKTRTLSSASHSSQKNTAPSTSSSTAFSGGYLTTPSISKATNSRSSDQGQMDSNIVSISCIRCNRTYSATQDTNTGVLQCSLCRWTFQSPVHLRCHIDHFHTDDTKCPLCPYVLKKGGVTVMDQHYKTAHPDAKIFHCYLCESEFTRKACLHNHVVRHFKQCGKYECPHCHMKFEQERRVNVHVVRCHSLLLGYPRRGDVDLNEKTTFMCGICGKQYNYAGSLHLHLKKHQFDTVDGDLNKVYDYVEDGTVAMEHHQQVLQQQQPQQQQQQQQIQQVQPPQLQQHNALIHEQTEQYDVPMQEPAVLQNVHIQEQSEGKHQIFKQMSENVQLVLQSQADRQEQSQMEEATFIVDLNKKEVYTA